MLPTAMDLASGWLMQHADKPANIEEEDSETPWLTSQVIDLIESRDALEQNVEMLV